MVRRLQRYKMIRGKTKKKWQATGNQEKFKKLKERILYKIDVTDEIDDRITNALGKAQEFHCPKQKKRKETEPI
jgi:hypothetical protein